MKRDQFTETPADVIHEESLDDHVLSVTLYIRPPTDTDAIVTQMLDNNVGYLDSLRRTLESTNNKGVPDVRMYGESMASTVLAGVEDEVSYGDLVAIINSMKSGIARRRVALTEEQS